MKVFKSRIIWGLLLIAGGVIFLLENLKIVRFTDLFWMAVMGIVGIGFLSVFISNRQHWWTLIPGFSFLAVTAARALEYFFPETFGDWSGAVILGGIGLSFLLVYMVNTRNWWAIIPMGLLFTNAGVVICAEKLSELEIGGLYFGGMGLTFLLVAILPNPIGRQKWAFIPAGVLLLLGLFLVFGWSDLLKYAFPASLILLGIYLVFRTMFKRG